MFCSNCGKELPGNAKFCDACGQPVVRPDSAPVKEPEPAPIVIPTPEPERNKTANEPVDEPAFARKPEPEPVVPAENRPLSPWGYFGYGLLFSIPIIGFILLIVFSFAGKNVNRKNFARSYWCWFILSLALILILVILILTGLLHLTGDFGAWLSANGFGWLVKLFH